LRNEPEMPSWRLRKSRQLYFGAGHGSPVYHFW
jgi:hypothetical protein